jgi:hypothetical protein
MAKSIRREKILEEKRKRQQAKQNPSGESKYGKKKKYLDRHGFYGYQVPEPKPWK